MELSSLQDIVKNHIKTMKHIHTFENFENEGSHSKNIEESNSATNEAKLVGAEWSAWVDIEDALRGIYIKYNKKVDAAKISEFIQEQADEYKKVGPTLK